VTATGRSADDRALQRFLDVNHLDLSDVVADVAVRVMSPERARAELEPPSLMIRHLVRDVVAAGGLRAVNLSEFVAEELTRRALFAGMPRADRARLADRLASVGAVSESA
jgi:hypothetical protein